MTDMKVFGLTEPYVCDQKVFFKGIGHSSFWNCSCPKFDVGVSCVPPDMHEAWFHYIGLKG